MTPRKPTPSPWVRQPQCVGVALALAVIASMYFAEHIDGTSAAIFGGMIAGTLLAYAFCDWLDRRDLHRHRRTLLRRRERGER